MTSPHRAMNSPRYHHGDLAASLLESATHLIREGGIEALSLRKLAARVGVTPAALYHHFRDKNDLLCALAERGFEELEARVSVPLPAASARLEDDLRAFVRSYIAFADGSPEQYDLMFGRTIWKAGEPTEALRAVAHGAFRRYLERIGALAGALGAEPTGNPLRIAQASWALLHGRLRIDGIYVDAGDVDAMSDEAVRMILARIDRG